MPTFAYLSAECILLALLFDKLPSIILYYVYGWIAFVIISGGANWKRMYMAVWEAFSTQLLCI